MAENFEKYDLFVGNLMSVTTIEQIKELFKIAGAVKNVRLLFDKDTGRPKGYAFVEYYEPTAALAAIKMLDKYNMNGKALKVSFADNSNLKRIAEDIRCDTSENLCAEGVQNIINKKTSQEQWDIVRGFKDLLELDYGAAKILLEKNPQLALALVDILRKPEFQAVEQSPQFYDNASFGGSMDPNYYYNSNLDNQTYSGDSSGMLYDPQQQQQQQQQQVPYYSNSSEWSNAPESSYYAANAASTASDYYGSQSYPQYTYEEPAASEFVNPSIFTVPDLSSLVSGSSSSISSSSSSSVGSGGIISSNPSSSAAPGASYYKRSRK